MSTEDHIVFTASDRINQLNNIDKEIAKLLQSAGLAVKALTKPATSPSAEGMPSQPKPIELQKESFTTATSQYFTLLSSVDVNLRRQIYALEEVEILPAEAVTKEIQINLAVPSAAHAHFPNLTPSRAGEGNKGAIIGGGLGNLDVGWLNSRNDKVGKDINSELWREATRFVHQLEGKGTGSDQDLDIDKHDSQEDAANVF